MAVPPDEIEHVYSIYINASPERVFAAWTDAEQLAAWWWPQLAGTTYDVDVRPGGRFRIQSAAIKVRVWGVYTEVEPPRRLVFTWNWEDEGEPGDPAEAEVL